MVLELASRNEVIVVGGGPAGIAAAVSAARNGADTLLVERYGFLGGMATAGLVNPFMPHHIEGKQVIGGVLQEIYDRLTAIGGAVGPIKILEAYDGATVKGQSYMPFDPEALKFVALHMIEESGVQLLLHSYMCDVIMKGSEIEGVEVVNKSGRQLLLGEIIIDATGDGDVAAMAGATFQKGRESDGLTQPGSIMFRMGSVDMERFRKYMIENPDKFRWRFPHCEPIDSSAVRENHQKVWVFGGAFKDLVKEARDRGEKYVIGKDWVSVFANPRRGEVTINATRVQFDGTDAKDLTRAEIEGRKQVEWLLSLLKKAPGFEDAYLLETAPQIGPRETRRILGEYVITGEDVLEGRNFGDVIAKGCFAVDIHDPKGRGGVPKILRKPYDIPYRCLVPKNVENLLLAGRCISSTHEANASLRVMPICVATGQAAGTAAALCIKENVSPRELNVAKLQETLVSQGAILYESQIVKNF